MENPFKLVEGELIFKNGRSRTVTDEVTGEVLVLVEGGGGVFRRDVSVFVKVFRNPILRDLSHVGLRLFLHLIFTCKPNIDWVVINIRDAMGECGLKYRADVYRGIADLVEKGVISKKEKGVYWINPHVLYNGNRIERPSRRKVF